MAKIIKKPAYTWPSTLRMWARGSGSKAFGVYLKALRDITYLTNDELVDKLALKKEAFERGDAATVEKLRNDIVSSFLPYVRNIAFSFEYSGVPIGDIIQEGNLGLMRAVEKYDPERGITLITYSRSYIWGAMMRFVYTENLAKDGVDKPLYLLELGRELSRLSKDFLMTNGRAPDHEELAEIVDLPLKTVDRALTCNSGAFNHSFYSVRRDESEEELDLQGDESFSELDGILCFGKISQPSIIDEFLQGEELSPEERVFMHEREALFDSIFRRLLTPREEKIIQLFYFEDKSYSEISAICLSSEDKVRGRKQAAIRKLRVHNLYFREFKSK
ncbi:hypothetical protein A2230_06555 [candidate division WOR-1 bacterium RIFOXYA2_FULL_36_21]|uniref:RNA polymerase sigma-70 domain-containing protein n=1 Tax=candidate division WOR-1 bacterium RIFOXYB2_FULL_36_35 TaxID=1802578 RepID=A0A1F4S3G6_UNCSA|nr:MAG: hypothetical protein A2230_06555 [candidate division WOR-1 bacterium RIFOXYA2_FULL_36_21]OGC14917.1 MAG: hypothetical protein A2290_07455 [candidate division WOR-1 bacterium RIFOXYB2_FULL_36_35]OGC16746.1 MAG: hypothetical protein A2282_04010 [candidate division WOR-1 bacterium RIFOXYA12_FULL_36_13]